MAATTSGMNEGPLEAAIPLSLSNYLIMTSEHVPPIRLIMQLLHLKPCATRLRISYYLMNLLTLK